MGDPVESGARSSWLDLFLAGMIFAPLGGVLYWAGTGDLPDGREIAFLVVLEVVLVVAAWRRKAWPFGPD